MRVEESTPEAKRRGEAGKQYPAPLADFGRRWPPWPKHVCHDDFAARIDINIFLEEMDRRMAAIA